MHFGSDESGDFNMTRPWDQSCSVWATVVCPDRHIDRVCIWVADRRHQWGVDELHARPTATTRALTPRERHEVCAFVGTGDLLWEATVVDSVMLSAADVTARQVKQQRQFRRDWTRSKRAQSADPADLALGERIDELLDPAEGVKAAPFTQYATVAPGHLHEAVQATLRVYQDRKWRDEFRVLNMAFDRKNEPERTAETPGEVLFFNAVMPILASPKMALSLPPPFQDPSHPLWTCHRAASGNGISIPSLFDGGVRFVDSSTHPLVQLADVLAYVLRRALTRPTDEGAARSFGVARRRLYMRTPVMFSGGDFTSLERYHHVLR